MKINIGDLVCLKLSDEYGEDYNSYEIVIDMIEQEYDTIYQTIVDRKLHQFNSEDNFIRVGTIPTGMIVGCNLTSNISKDDLPGDYWLKSYNNSVHSKVAYLPRRVVIDDLLLMNSISPIVGSITMVFPYVDGDVDIYRIYSSEVGMRVNTMKGVEVEDIKVSLNEDDTYVVVSDSQE